MKAQKFSKEGKLVSEIELPAALFESKYSSGAIYDAIKAENANLRSGNHSTKTRAEVSGGGKKPWSQKGTGRARQGSIRAPQWVGGGTVHGPKKRDYSYKVSPKVKRRAVLSILNKKAQGASIKVIENLDPKEYSTKAFDTLFKNIGLRNTGTIGLLVDGENVFLKKSVRNIPTVKYINSKRISCRDILYNRNIVITEGALGEMLKHYGESSK
ncbi:50S ribosomal protein L4 [Leptospira perolatii]|uniref:Large ribosomal subunit protein uL4 n=1 Tax=Leptospira perolatii TaxID=2023191 RepID=A0A2M9ZLZ9_9LEPT|nr:50S ribosomal protein L4 [Leptospira perolatii]PJZ69150.1 50S ribosomal protein L4 [Leptospira perolatii]PJZ73106.1 50S ribosomal protein L4 [Leptospira perolatii]